MSGVNPIARFLGWFLRPAKWNRPRVRTVADDPQDGAAGGVLAPLVPPVPTPAGSAAKRLGDESG